MVLPKIHSFTWSDSDQTDVRPSGPLRLKDKELHVWATYPEREQGRNQGKRKGSKQRSRKLKLWAVLIIETVKRLDDYAYEVHLRRIYKKDERFIRVEVVNDPADQCEDACVFRLVHPRPKEFDPLEERLAMAAAKRVYDAIAETWPGRQPVLTGEENGNYILSAENDRTARSIAYVS
jgi:hypothetical protein